MMPAVPIEMSPRLGDRSKASKCMRRSGADPGEVPGVTGETGTSGACGTTNGLLGLKFGVSGGGSAP